MASYQRPVHSFEIVGWDERSWRNARNLMHKARSVECVRVLLGSGKRNLQERGLTLKTIAFPIRSVDLNLQKLKELKDNPRKKVVVADR